MVKRSGSRAFRRLRAPHARADQERARLRHGFSDALKPPDAINQAVRIQQGGSGPPFHDGWHRELFFDPRAALELDPPIADVHTDPSGDFPIARGASVLHVGTGMPRAMLVSVDT